MRQRETGERCFIEASFAGEETQILMYLFFVQFRNCQAVEYRRKRRSDFFKQRWWLNDLGRNDDIHLRHNGRIEQYRRGDQRRTTGGKCPDDEVRIGFLRSEKSIRAIIDLVNALAVGLTLAQYLFTAQIAVEGGDDDADGGKSVEEANRSLHGVCKRLSGGAGQLIHQAVQRIRRRFINVAAWGNTLLSLKEADCSARGLTIDRIDLLALQRD